MSVSSSSYSPSCQRVTSRCREKSQHARCSARSFHWSNADSRLAPGSTNTWSTDRQESESLHLEPDGSVPTSYLWSPTDGGSSSKEGSSGSLVEVISWTHAFLRRVQVSVGVDSSGDHQLTISIHHPYPSWDNQVLPDLPDGKRQKETLTLDWFLDSEQTINENRVLLDSPVFNVDIGVERLVVIDNLSSFDD